MFKTGEVITRKLQNFNDHELSPGCVDIRYFRLLISISSISNQKLRSALEAVLVNGMSRKEACTNFNVNQGYFSVKYSHLQFVNQTVIRMAIYIKNDFN